MFIQYILAQKCKDDGERPFARHFISVVCVYTGNPKGVMLTHGNVVADFSGFLKVTDVSDTSALHKVAVSEDSFPFLEKKNVIWMFLPFCLLQKVIFPNQDDCLISFLPLAHMFERLIEVIEIFAHRNETWKENGCLWNDFEGGR